MSRDVGSLVDSLLDARLALRQADERLRHFQSAVLAGGGSIGGRTPSSAELRKSAARRLLGEMGLEAMGQLP